MWEGVSVDLAQSMQRADASLFLEGKRSAQSQNAHASAPRRAKRRTSVGPADALPPVGAPRNPACLSQTAHTARHPHPTRLAPTRFARGHQASQLTLASQASAGTLLSLSVHRNLALRLTRRCWRWGTPTQKMLSACRALGDPSVIESRGGPDGVKPSALSRSTDPEHAGAGRRVLCLDRCVPAEALCLS